MTDNFFNPIQNTKPYFKAGIEGFAGSGKTYTAALIAIGLHKRIKSKKPVVIFDTEKASKFLKELFEEAEIEVLVKESRSMADLAETMKRMREDNASDVLIIDSISHVWENFLNSFMKKKNRTYLQFQDWGIIKPTWKTQFSDPFVTDPYHVIMCGRAGHEYGNEVNPETGKREIFKSGIKMKVEGETAYEPDMLVLMERFEEVLDREKKVWREATILKDRSQSVDGKTFKNPTYDDFAPAVEIMLKDPSKTPISAEGDTQLLFKTEDETAKWIREKKKAIENLEGLLTRIEPASTGKGKKLKLDLLDKVFGTTSMTEIGEMSVPVLKDGYKKIGLEAVALGIAEIIEDDGKKRLVSKVAKASDNPELGKELDEVANGKKKTAKKSTKKKK